MRAVCRDWSEPARVPREDAIPLGARVGARLRINGVIVESQTSPGGNRILRHRFVYVKDGPESNTDFVQVTIETVGGGYAQGIVLDIQRTDVGI